MKAIRSLITSITDPKFFSDQFAKEAEKRILFVSPTVNSKGFYQYLVPYYNLLELKDCNTAVTSAIRKHRENPYDYTTDIKDRTEEIEWATHIVFPFCYNDLLENDYFAIRSVNPDAKIVFFVDFNFYEMPSYNPLKPFFSSENSLKTVESNILNADIVLVNNLILHKAIGSNLTKRMSDPSIYPNPPEPKCLLNVFPYILDSEIITQTIDDFQTKKHRMNASIESATESIVKEEITAPKTPEKSKTSKASKATVNKGKKTVKESVSKDIKKVDPKTVKKSNKKPVKASKKNVKTKNTIKAKGKKSKSGQRRYKNSKPVAVPTGSFQDDKAGVPFVPVEAPTTFDKIEVKKIGIFWSEYSKPEIKALLPIIASVKNKFGESVEFILIGIRTPEAEEICQEFNFAFTYVEPVSIIHWYKMLKNIEINAALVLLEQNRYNATSETSAKFLECSFCEIPLIAPDMGQYKYLLVNPTKGILYNQKVQNDHVKDLETTLNHVLTQVSNSQLQQMAEEAKALVSVYFDTSEINVQNMSEKFE